jgi:uncharacterized protein (UPF0276 family)
VQSYLKRPMLLENPSTYIAFNDSDIPETAFIHEVIQRTGCGLLLDVNNVHVSCANHGWDARSYLSALPLAAVQEIHLAGYADHTDNAGDVLLIDSHDAPVSNDVWQLYESVLAAVGPIPTLIERDGNIPPFPLLLEEAQRAAQLLEKSTLSTPMRKMECSV